MDEDNDVWLGRSWIEQYGIFDQTIEKRLKFVSYNVLSNNKCTALRYTTTRDWEYRSRTLLREISAYHADILCLQDADLFKEFWRPQLMLLGYDSIFKSKTKLKATHEEGVIIAYKRELFQLFKTVEIEFNDAAPLHPEKGTVFKDLCLSDDIGLIVFLQPWIPRTFPSLCIGCAMFKDSGFNAKDVRSIQSQYFSRQLELANQEFQLPIILGINLNDSPSSPAYHVFRTGRTPLRAERPKKCQSPKGVPYCRSSMRLTWYPPPMTPADPAIISYRISWRPGGSLTLGFRAQTEVNNNDCLQYKEIIDKNGDRKNIVLDELSCVIADLTAETPYEFRVTAVNSEGEGLWSEPSLPLTMPNPDKAPSMPELRYLKNVQGIIELRESVKMETLDWNANKSLRTDAMKAFTNLTPRTLDDSFDKEIPRGRVLPLSCNPREGWNAKLYGGQPKEMLDFLNRDFIIRQSVLRTHKGFSNSISDTATGKAARIEYANETPCQIDNSAGFAHGVNDSVVTFAEGDKSHSLGFKDCNDKDINDESDDEEGDFGFGDLEESVDEVNEELKEEIITSIQQPSSDFQSQDLVQYRDEEENPAIPSDDAETDLSASTTTKRRPKLSALHKPLPSTYKASTVLADQWNDDVIIDCKEVLRSVGRPNIRQIHSMNLRSAYESVCSGGDPMFTAAMPSDVKEELLVECLDYIFYSAASLVPVRVLSLPQISLLRGDDPREPIMCEDQFNLEPSAGWKTLFNGHAMLLSKSAHRGCSEDISESALYSSSSPFLDHDINKGPIPKSKISDMKKALLAVLAKSQMAGPDGPSSSVDSFWGGVYSVNPVKNTFRNHFWLPNDNYCSSHLAICAEFSFAEIQ